MKYIRSLLIVIVLIALTGCKIGYGDTQKPSAELDGSLQLEQAEYDDEQPQ